MVMQLIEYKVRTADVSVVFAEAFGIFAAFCTFVIDASY